MSIRVGLLGKSSLLSISKSGRLEGVLGNLLMKEVFFPKNCTFYSAYNLDENFADALVEDVDFIKNLPSPTELRHDLTTGPPYSEINCYLISDKKTSGYQEIRKFHTSFGAIEFDVGILTIIATILLILFLKIISHESLFQLLWKYLTMSSHVYPKLTTQKMSGRVLSVSILVWLVLIKIIFLSFIRTELVMKERGQDIETFDDVIKRNMSIAPSYRTQCYRAWKNIAHYSSSFNESFQAIPKSELDSDKKWHKTGLIDKVIIGGESAMLSARLGRCTASDVSSNTIHGSKKAVFSQILSQILYRHLDGKKRSGLLNWAYANLELGHEKSDARTLRKIYEFRSKKLLNSRCLDVHRKPLSSPELRISFLADCFWLFYMFSIFSSIIFFFELNNLSILG